MDINADSVSRFLFTIRERVLVLDTAIAHNANIVEISDKLVEESDQSLFKHVSNDNYHVLNCLLPDERHYCYNLRDRTHNRELHITSRLLDCNFLTRLLFKDSY